MPDAWVRAVRRTFITIIVAVTVSAIAGPASAQFVPGGTTQSQEAPEQPSPNDIRELTRLLSDPDMVEWLRAQGQQEMQAISAADAAEGLQQELAARVEGIRQRLTDLATSWRNLPAAPAFLAEVWRAQMSAGQSLRTITYVVIFLVVGSGLEWLYRQYTQSLLLRLELRHARSLRQRTQAAALRALIVFAGILIFSVGTVGTFLSFDWPPFVESVVLTLLTAVIAIRAAATVSLFFLAPRVAELRLVPLSNDLAAPLHRWVVTTSAFAVIALSVTDIFVHLASDTDALGATLAVSVAAVGAVAIVIILTVWHLHGIVRSRAGDGDTATGKGSRFWPVYLTIVTILVWFLWLLGAAEMMWTVIILGLLFPFIRLLNGCLDHVFDQAEGKGLLRAASAFPFDNVTHSAETQRPDTLDGPIAPPGASRIDDTDEDETTDSLELYRPVARRFVRFVAVLCALFALLAAWGGNIFSLSESETFSGRLVGILADIITAVLIADLVWVWAKSAIDRRLANYVPPQGSEAPGPEARMATLLPILRVTLMVTLIAVVIMTIMASVGINVGPLLAGAGVIGIAVGFGAQALVKDIVSGIFFLIDDAFRVGEYIEIGELRGTVESMSVRSLRVRHHLGAIHTIPFGELKSLTNYSRDWVIMRLEFRVPFDTDLKLVKKIVKKIGTELQENEAYGDSIIQTLKSQGVRRMEEFNMVVGVKFMAKPGAQWLIRRDAYQKLRDAFEANGISFAQRNVTVEVLGDQPLSEEARKAIAGAAQNAVEPPAQPAAAVPDEP